MFLLKIHLTNSHMKAPLSLHDELSAYDVPRGVLSV